jgi:hypothetical protein
MTRTCAACLHTNQSRLYLNHLVFALIQSCGPCNGDDILFLLGCELDIEMTFRLISYGAMFLPNLLQIACSS